MRSMRQKVEELDSVLDELEEGLREACGIARRARRTAVELGLPEWVAGQLEGYLEGNVKAFIDSEHQIGSIWGIRRGLEGLIEDEDAQAREEREDVARELEIEEQEQMIVEGIVRQGPVDQGV